MKRMPAFLVSAVCIGAFTACGTAAGAEQTPVQETTTAEQNADTSSVNSEETEEVNENAEAAGGSMVREFDFENRTVALNSGYTMPINGLGTYSLHGEECINAVKTALASGVRLIDTASAYGNEEEIGQAIRESMEELGISREEVFVTTKLYLGTEMADPEKAIQDCLDWMNIGYVDLMLLHHPDRNDVKAYLAMEKAVEEGKIRSIGLSNWYVEELGEFLPQVNITPALVQNEIHPYYQENDVFPYIQSLGIVVEAGIPLVEEDIQRSFWEMR
ncbi:MAG: aldo/keto reductase [Eubacteriales bacterium]|nr:aldo/keto reductase [Eubacteriales bacterium]